MKQTRARRTRDPQKRKQEIIAAAAELVAEIGPAGLSHRAVAARAGVALGSTTAYFATLDDLRTAALEVLAQDVDAYVADVARVMEHGENPVPELAVGLHAYLSERRLVRAEAMLSAAAVIDTDLRRLTERWYAGLSQALTPRWGAETSALVVMLISGATWHAALHDEPPALGVLEAGLTAVCGGAEAAAR
jgi:DNA-binding transcriptional regulator YbjK